MDKKETPYYFSVIDRKTKKNNLYRSGSSVEIH